MLRRNPIPSHSSPSLVSRLWRRPWRLSRPTTPGSAQPGRVECDVAGASLWFESPDVKLAESVEALGSAVLFPAAARKRSLVFEIPPDPAWMQNVPHALAKAAEWWNYPELKTPPPPRATPILPSVKQHSAATLCFSGGVDSFYSLLRGEHKVGTLAFVHGFDIPLPDTDRAAAAEASLRSIAAELNIRPVMIRTNVRKHPALRNSNWEHVHGGALAAIGHLLADYSSTLLISASYPLAFDRPWGSHWALDPWWSSSRVAVTHVGAEVWRTEKLLALANEPIVQRHLRVCWENRQPTGNCGSCEKCLRTMLILEGHGLLDAFQVFPNAAVLAENLSSVPYLRADLIPVYTRFLETELRAQVQAAVSALVERSRCREPRRNGH